MKKATAIILAGGKSSRMGTNKALLTFQGQTLIERTKDALEETFDDIILVTNEQAAYEFLNIKMASDFYENAGPLAGFHAGLSQSRNEANFFVACDMPFLSMELASFLLAKLGTYDAVVPIVFGKIHPLFSVFKKNTVEEVIICIEAGQRRIKDLLSRLNVLYITEGDITFLNDYKLDQAFYNMNKPTDYEQAKKIVSRRGNK
jgi:molybdenum cofactor guanylyltransferase